MKRLYNLIAGHEDWLIRRVLQYAKERGYVKYTSTLEEAWRISIKDGWQVLAELKSMRETVGIPVIVVSMTDDKQRGFSLGASDFFLKPVDKSRFIATVRNLRNCVPRKPETVLVIDDDPFDVELLTYILQREGYNVLKAYGGRQGIELAVKRLPDMIILDLMMPEVNGFDVVEQVRAHPDAGKIPIVIYTAKDLTSKDREQLNDHVHGIAAKSGSGKEILLWEIERLGKGKWRNE